VQYASGISINLKQLSQACQANHCLLCVDAIQSLGAIPFNQQDIQADFVVADGHKWMMGAEGLALMYVKQSLQDSLKLTQYGWHMVAQRGNYDAQEWTIAKDATRFECGSPNMLGIHVLNASIRLLLKVGIEQVHQRIVERIRHIESALKKHEHIQLLSPETPDHYSSSRSGIITF
ncbi:MAG: aminotransferase, partial [Phototrophicales bacterium]